MTDTYYIGTVPKQDDFGTTIGTVFYDGKTRQGPWATMAHSSFKAYGVGIGPGKGQKYKKQKDGRWLKVDG